MARPKPLVWYDAEEVPRAGVASSDALARRQRLYRIWVGASVALAPLAFLAALVSVARPGPPAAADGAAGRAAATVALESWLAAKPSPLPGGHLVDWAGASALGSSGGKPGWRAEDERFTVVAGGRYWLATLEMAVEGGAASVVGGPYLQAEAPGPGAPPSGPWPRLQASTSAPPLVTAAIAGWARAYCSGNPSELRLAVGDNDPAHVYVPLSGVVAERVQVAWYARRARSSSAVAQVDLFVRWAGQKAMPPRPLVMDLLVARASGLAPLVVSWGPPGSGPSLTTYRPQ